VLLNEVLEHIATALNSSGLSGNGKFIDFTFGLGGHSLAALSRFASLGVIGIETDPTAIELSKDAARGFVSAGRLSIHNCNFADFDSAVSREELKKTVAALADLGISSYQIDSRGRGFSFDDDDSLDMRMNPAAGGESGYDVVNSYSEEELADIFFRFGDERLSRKIAYEILKRRKNGPISSCRALADIVRSVYHRYPSIRMDIDFATRAVMALRIFVNLELEKLGVLLDKTLDHFPAGARVMIISFHSKEDSVVKEFIKSNSSTCTCPPRLPACVCGKKPRVRPVTRKTVIPSDGEKNINPRSRSARMRVYEVL